MWQPREAMNRETALHQWRQAHVHLVEQVPGVRRYVQDHCVVGPDGSEPPYAGIGEVWFDSMEEARAALKTAEWLAVIEDASTFMDLDNVTAAWADEHPIF
jgi:uncharacterized protein (TIGR02118 family)